MLKNGIILFGLVQNKPNDSTTLSEIIDDLKETLIILERLQFFYGERFIYKEIRDALEKYHNDIGFRIF